MKAVNLVIRASEPPPPSLGLIGLTLNRPGFLQIGMAWGRADSVSPRNFCLNGPIDLKVACR